MRRSPAATPVGTATVAVTVCDSSGNRDRLSLQAHPGRVGTEHPQLVPADQRAGVVHGDQHLDVLGAEFDPVRGDEHPHGQPPAPGTLAGSSGRVKSAVGAPPPATVTSVVRASVVEPCAVSV